jgi:hypothetical protein
VASRTIASTREGIRCWLRGEHLLEFDPRIPSFEMELAPDGRKRAVRVRRPGAAAAVKATGAEQVRHRARPPAQPAESSASLGARFVALLLVAGLGWYAYGQ